VTDFENFNSKNLFYRFLDENYLDKTGRVKEEIKYKINNSSLKIQNSKLIGKTEDKFETLLFLPPNSERIGEGGLRTKGYFKHSYKLKENIWHICGIDEDCYFKASDEISKKIERALKNLKSKNIDSLPLLTVITVVYNRKSIEKTIKSVIEQSYPNIEYIIIDGGSTDGTIDIIKKYEDYIDYWVSEKDGGIYDAMNKGIKLAKGDLLAFLNAGDIYFKDIIEKVIPKFSNNYKNEIYTGWQTYLIEETGLEFIVKRSIEDLKKCVPAINPISHIATFFGANIFKRCGLYDLSYRCSSDYDMVLKANKMGFKVIYMEELIGRMDFVGFSNTSIEAMWRGGIENYRLRKNYCDLNIVFNLFLLSYSLLKGLLRILLLKTFPTIYYRRNKFTSSKIQK
jgi:glycosyltransferase involved in cell wall biosynthesis